MRYFICVVSKKLLENYLIGLRAKKWGVEKKHLKRISKVHQGDYVTFLVGGQFRSIHRIESAYFSEDTILWPPKDGSVYPYRINISSPICEGHIPVGKLSENISFMKGKDWSWVMKGWSSVFNDKSTKDDFELIKSKMNCGTEAETVTPAKMSTPTRKATPPVLESQKALFKFYEKDIEDRISDLLDEMGLELYHNKESGRNGRQFQIDGGRIDLLCIDKSTRDFVVIELKKGEAPNDSLLQILRYMSSVRQNLADKRDVKGIILTEQADTGLIEIIKEVPNVQVKYYKVTITLV